MLDLPSEAVLQKFLSGKKKMLLKKMAESATKVGHKSCWIFMHTYNFDFLYLSVYLAQNLGNFVSSLNISLFFHTDSHPTN